MALEALLLRLLLLHELVAELLELEEGVLERAQARVDWVFPGARLLVLPPEAAQGFPERGPAHPLGREGYGAYFPGPPAPLYLFLEHPGAAAGQELRLAALFMDLLVEILKAQGYRAELARQARTDWLTGLGNRMAFERSLAQGLPEGWALLLLDVDGLKAVNDKKGHPAGDLLLKEVAGALKALEGPGRAFRIGGDEFALFLPEERLGEALEALKAFPVSVGVALAQEAQGEALYALADERMYRVKRGGR